jgi:FixJ family two-component response regulator
LREDGGELGGDEGSMMSGDGRRVVLVDDDASMSCALERMLRLADYQPAVFASAEVLLQSDAIDEAACLVLDVHLPGVTGFELYERLRRDGTKTPPVIFITAYDDPESRARADRAGAAAYLTKPFSGNDLVAAVAHAIKPRITSPH